MNTSRNLADLIGRILIAAIFLISGLGKVTGYAGTQGYRRRWASPGRCCRS